MAHGMRGKRQGGGRTGRQDMVRKVMRTSRVVPKHVLLPETVRIIWDGAMQQSDSLAGGFDVNWSTLDAALDTDWFGGDVVIGNKTFAYSGLQGDVVLPRDCTICDNGFAACEGITSLEAPSSYYCAIALGSDILSDCTNLKTVHFGDMAQDNGLYAGLFTGCDSLTDVYLDGTGVPKLIMEGRFAFQFNFGWDKDYETQHLRIHVPGTPGTEEYANRVMNYATEWRYAFGGCTGGLDENGYRQMWNDVQMELMDPLTYEMPENAAVDGGISRRFDAVRPGEYARACQLMEKAVYGGIEPEPFEERTLVALLEKLAAVPEGTGWRTRRRLRYVGLRLLCEKKKRTLCLKKAERSFLLRVNPAAGGWGC